MHHDGVAHRVVQKARRDAFCVFRKHGFDLRQQFGRSCFIERGNKDDRRVLKN
jgi:hypothetical protein